MNDLNTVILDRITNRYKCLQTEFYMIEETTDHIVINWHSYNDPYVNHKRVIQIAKSIRKYTRKPIYSAIGLLNV